MPFLRVCWLFPAKKQFSGRRELVYRRESSSKEALEASNVLFYLGRPSLALHLLSDCFL